MPPVVAAVVCDGKTELGKNLGANHARQTQRNGALHSLTFVNRSPTHRGRVRERVQMSVR